MYSGSRPVRPSFAYGAFTLSGWLSQNHSAGSPESVPRSLPRCARTAVWPPPISLAATLGIDVSFSSSPYLDVSVQAVPLHMLWIHTWMVRGFRTGFPHSDTCGSLDICSSPQLFAAYHVFLRLSVPRHPPCALFCLTSSIHSVVSFLLAFKNFDLSVRRPDKSFGLLFVFSDVLISFPFTVLLFPSGKRFIKIYLYEVFKVQFPARLPWLMETERFELLTPCLQGRCSPN